MRILAPLDDSTQSQRALTYAQALATATGGSLNLVRVTDLDDEAHFNSLASNARRLQDAGVAVEWSVVSGVDAQTAVRETEAAWQPDLIVMATNTSSGADRWLNGSVAEAVVKSARVPVLLVPRDWDRSLVARGTARVLVALDGSTSAERAVDVVLHLVSRLPSEYVLVRAIHAERDRHGAEDYLAHMATRMESMLDGREVAWRVLVESPVTVISNSARELDVDAIAMSTRGQGAAHLLSIGSTAAQVVDQATVPVILLGPDFTYNEFATPPTTWTEIDHSQARERARLGPTQREITDGTRVLADDGELGHVSQVDYDPDTGHLIALWVRADGLRRPRLRNPGEWLSGGQAHVDLRVGGSRTNIAAYLVS